MNNKYAYITLATDLNYLIGAQLLHHSLKRVKSKYPLIIMITDNLVGSINIDSEYIYKIVPYKAFTQIDSVYNNCLNKFYAFDCIQYEKFMFLDADCFILKNIDNVFVKQKHSIFAGSWSLDTQNNLCVFGAMFLAKPIPNLILQVINNPKLFNKPTDEQIFAQLFLQELKAENSIEYLFDDIIHMGGTKKYWYYIKNIDCFIQKIYTLSQYELEKIFREIFNKN